MPLTVIAIISNLGPMVTVVMAYLILKEKIKKFEMGIMLISLVVVVVFSLTGYPNDDPHAAKSSIPMWVLYLALSCNPLLSAGGTIAMRKMKKFHEAVVSWYLNIVLIITSTTIILVLGQGWTIFLSFSYLSWGLMVGIGVLAVTSQTTRFKALKLQKAAKLQILTPVITLLQFAYDLGVGTKFSIPQFVSIGVLMFLYFI